MFRKGHKAWNRGKTGVYSAEALKKMGAKRVGVQPSNYKGGSWQVWQKRILKRDRYICQICGMNEPGIMEVAHLVQIKGLKNRIISGHPLNSYENLITLCPNDHTRMDKGFIKYERK